MWPSRSDVAYLREKAVQYRRYAPLCETTVAAKLHETALVLEALSTISTPLPSTRNAARSPKAKAHAGGPRKRLGR